MLLSYDADWSAYKLIILPGAFLLKEAHREKLKAYVKNGGHLAATFLTGAKNGDNVVIHRVFRQECRMCLA